LIIIFLKLIFICPSYNIQSIIDPFTGNNHYRYGKSLSEPAEGGH